jgi:hypothetical protein
MGVRTIQQHESLDGVWEELVYTEARLLNEPLAKDLAKVFASLIARTEKTMKGQRDAWRSEIVAQAGVDATDDELDDCVSDLGVELSYLDGGKKSGARFKRYFGKAPSVVIRMGLASEVTAVEGWPSSLKKEGEPKLKSLGKRLDAILAAAKKVLGGRSDAANARADHRVKEIISLIDDVNGARVSAYGVLMQRGQKDGLAKDFAERFFRRVQRAPREVSTEPVPAKTGTPAS